MIPRFFSRQPLHPGATVELSHEAAHHAMKVLRLAAGDAVILFDGRGGQWTTTLQPAGKTVRAVLAEFDDRECEAPLEIHLIQALPASDKMDWIVQKAVELGVTHIQPVASKRSVIRLSGERMERRVEHWRNVAIAACEQCGRNRVPVVGELEDLSRFLGQLVQENAATQLRLIAAPGATIALRDLPRPSGSTLILIGPEGGFEDNELLAAQTAGFKAVGLGPRVLRTETAGLAAVSAAMVLWGDL
jgi:16S rRNA (uracil1498-N3)-methyltransferase